MKKFIISALILVMTLCLLFGCKNNNPQIKPDDSTSSTDNSLLFSSEKVVKQTKVVTYDGPGIIESSPSVGVKVNDNELFVYDTRINHLRSFTYTPQETQNQVVLFDFEGRINIEIEIKGETQVKDVVVRPLIYDITPSIDGNKISFELEYPDNYVVEYNTNSTQKASDNALHIFANPIEKESIDPQNLPEKTLYLGPGLWKANALPVYDDDMTIYLAGGAVVYGQIRADGLKNLTICGRGIFSGEIYDRTKDSEFTLPIELQKCENVTIKDIAILDPAGWAVTLYKCKNVTINNLKVITARANGDGISVQSCENVNVNGGFIRTWDDSLVVKNVDNTSTKDITFDGVYVWTDLAQSMEVGYETYGKSMQNITFKNITVLHNFHKAVISMHNADNANISGVTYENITIEDAQMLGDNQLDTDNDFLIDMTIAFNTEWSKSGGERGTIQDVTIKNVKVLNMAKSIISRMYGEGKNSNIDGVNISNIEIEGVMAKNLSDFGLTPGVYTSNVNYSQNSELVGAKKVLPYVLELNNDSAEFKNHENITQTGLEVPEFAILKNQPTYAGIKVSPEKINLTATYGKGDRANSPWNNSNVPLSNENGYDKLIDGDRTSEWKFTNNLVDDEFVALNFNFTEPMQIGKIRFLGALDSNILSSYSISIFSKAEKEGDWKRIQSQTDISISPQDSNYTDIIIRLSENGYYGLQFRLFKKQGLVYPETVTIGEIEFYPPSLTTGKSFNIVCQHEDVYDIANILDGNPLTYFESKKGVFPAEFSVDFSSVENVKYINIHLPPLLLWEERQQEIEILGSQDGINYNVIVEKTIYTFNPEAGNMVAIILENAVPMRYIKLVYTSNSTGYGAQISELYVYGE